MQGKASSPLQRRLDVFSFRSFLKHMNIFAIFALVVIVVCLWLSEVNIYFNIGVTCFGVIWITVERYRELKKKKPVYKIIKKWFVNVWDILQGMG